MKNIFSIITLMVISSTFLLSSCYDEFDKTEAFEPFTRLTFTPADGDFEGATDVIIEITAPDLESATAIALGDGLSVDLGTLNFSNGVATLSVPLSEIEGADRINFTASNTDGRPFTTRYQISY
ncbi:hypothetical protein OKW21_003812 [Catalinimonas alkaloidigena]|uniref:hypothetical protein n=1 Tax=Catalinimonas alkaloidigena TaxID=1075417 RepID=UPI00240765C4|nr:hypothetical protein [Catalinimonas alkaloidigena]MDF9798549.1 hypothetical protein [Catalinimonas alkaloidigena]